MVERDLKPEMLQEYSQVLIYKHGYRKDFRIYQERELLLSSYYKLI